MKSERIRVGIIGLSATSGWARLAHAPALAQLPEFELRGLTASTPETAKAAAQAYGVPFWSHDNAALVARPDIDLIVCSVKVVDHMPLVEAALHAGKEVYCEWPLGRNSNEAEALAKLAQRYGRTGFVGLQARFSPVVSYLRELKDNGFFGDILSVNVLGMGANRRAPVARAQAFYLDQSNGGGTINIPVGHTLDGLCSLFGELNDFRALLEVRAPETTIAETGERVRVTTWDQVVLAGRFPGGEVMSLHYRGSISNGTTLRIEINGTHGLVVVEGIGPPGGNLQMVPVRVRGARTPAPTSGVTHWSHQARHEIALDDMPIPAEHSIDGLAQPVAAVARLYQAMAKDMTDGGGRVATFADAVTRHQMIDRIVAAGT